MSPFFLRTLNLGHSKLDTLVFIDLRSTSFALSTLGHRFIRNIAINVTLLNHRKDNLVKVLGENI